MGGESHWSDRTMVMMMMMVVQMLMMMVNVMRMMLLQCTSGGECAEPRS
jgi:hypothetical protein